MAESRIVQAILSGLSGGDPATLATPNETARIDVNCDGPKERDPVGGVFSILFPANSTKIVPSGGCVVKYLTTVGPDQEKDTITGKVSIFKAELRKSIKNISGTNKNIVYIKKEIARLFYEIFVSDAISNETIVNLPNLYLYNYRTEGVFGRPIELPGEEDINFNFKKISDFFFIPSEAIYSIIDVLKETEKDPIGVWTLVFLKVNGVAIDFASFNNQKSEENLTKLILEFIPFFNYTDNEIRGQDNANSSTLDYRYHGGYYTMDKTAVIAKLPDLSGRNYRGNSSYFYEDFESKIIMQLHSKKEGNDNYKNVILDFDLPFNGEINGYNSSFNLGESTEDFEIDLTGFNIDSATITPYLSLVNEDDKFSIEPQGYNDTKHRFVDYFICPNTEKFIDENKERINSISKDNQLYKSAISRINTVLSNGDKTSLSSSGLPTNLYGNVREYSSNKNEVFSLFSRQDELLASNEEEWPLGISIRRPGITKNWFSSKAMSSSSFGLQTTPRIYADHLIPESWIKGRISSGSDDSYTVIFSSSDINKINANRAVFSLYLSNGKGQVYRVSNQPVVIERSPPQILEVFPDGYKEGGSAIASGSDIFINGEGFLDNCIAKINGIVADIKSRSKNKLKVIIPQGIFGNASLTISNGGDSEDSSDIYISTSSSIAIAELPSRTPAGLRVIGNTVVAKNIGEIPLSYDSPNSSIEIKTKKLTFFDSIISNINAFLYIKTSDVNIVNFISNDYRKLGQDTYIFNDIKWSMAEGTDFAKKSLRSASLKFPGPENIRGPIESLVFLKNEDNTDVGIYIVDKASANLITENNSLKASFKLGNLPFFSPTPSIVGMAGSTEDFGPIEAYRNFDPGIFSENTAAVQKAISSELFNSGDGELEYGPIKSLYSINNLVVFFKSIQGEYPQKYTFYVAGKKVSIFDTKNVEKVYDSKNDGYSIFRATLSSVDTENLFAGVGSVIVKRKDRKRRVELSSENIYVEFSSENGVDVVEERASGRDKIYVLKEDMVLFPESGGTQLKAFNPFITNDNSGSGIFKLGTINSSIFGNVIKQSEDKPIELIDFNQEIKVLLDSNDRASSKVFSPITIQSPYSAAELFFSDGYEDFLKRKNLTQIKNNVDISFSPTELKYLPSSIAIRKGTQINQFKKAEIGDYSGKIKTFHRFRLTNYATVISNQPRILKVDPDKFAGGDTVTITVEKINVKKVKVFVNTTRAKIINSSDNKIVIVAPNDVDNIRLIDGKCQEIIIKPTKRTLLGAEGDLGLTFVNEALRAIADSINGFLKDKMGDVQALIDRIKQKFLSFINLKLDKVNIAKEFINSFCDMSFHLTAELNIYLKNFSILLIPVKVIFCIIDVICSLLNPAELAPAIVRLFECLYDLLLLLPPLAIPVLVLNLFLHLLELLECVITKIINTIAIVTIVIRAIEETSALISGDEEVDFKYLMMLEGVLLDNFLTIDADLQVLGPIVQILAIILQLLQLAFRFPCKIGPQTAEPDCGIDGTMLAGFLISTIQSDDGTLKTEYLLPVAQNKPKSSAILEDFSDENITIAEIRSTLTTSEFDDIDPPAPSSVAIEKTSDQTFIEAIDYNEENFRFNSNNNVCFVAAATKAVKKLSTPQKIKFLFKGVANASLFRRRVDFNSPIDSTVTLLNKINDNKINISPVSGNANRNFYSMMDGEAFINVKNEDGKVVGDVKPLTLPIEINLVTHLRTFVGIPKMILMDEKSNFYIIDNNGISFDDNLNIESISASIINTNSAPDIDYSRDSQDIENDDGDPESVTIFRFPKLYFVDVRAAAEIIQQQCSQFSINNFLFELSDVDETTRIVRETNDCLNAFIDGISLKVQDMRAETNRGLIPTPFPDNFAENLGQELIACINRGLNDICPQVINPLNTSFKILEDTDETPLGGFPDLTLSEDIMQGFQTDGPPLTGAREYAAGIGDSATLKVDREATLEVTPRDSYDEIIISDYDLSDKIDIQIISDTTGVARIVKKEYNNRLKNVIPDGTGKYYSYITASKPGAVRVRAKICSKAIQAITYAGLEDIVTGNIKSEIDCVPDTAASSEEDRIIPLGAQVRVDRILTIIFEERVESDIVSPASTKQDSDASPTQSGIFASGAE